MPKHSPGPWEFVHGTSWIVDAYGREVACDVEPDDMPLIAAAPEMLQMLRDIVDSPDATEIAAARRLIARLDNG